MRILTLFTCLLALVAGGVEAGEIEALSSYSYRVDPAATASRPEPLQTPVYGTVQVDQRVVRRQHPRPAYPTTSGQVIPRGPQTAAAPAGGTYIEERAELNRQPDSIRPQEEVGREELQVEESRDERSLDWHREAHRQRMDIRDADRRDFESAERAALARQREADRRRREELRQQERMISTISRGVSGLVRQSGGRGSRSSRSSSRYSEVRGELERLPGGEIVGQLEGWIRR